MLDIRKNHSNTLLFLGSGAADWDIKKRDGFFRRNSAALLNGELLLDCGPHVWDFVRQEDPHLLDRVQDVLITHDHSDHFDRDALLQLAAHQKIRVACDGYARAILGAQENITFVPVVPYTPFTIGKYHVMPVLANHDTVRQDDRQACHYILRTKNGKTLFYGLDGAWFLCPTWDELHRHTFDVMILDCTVGDRDDWRLFEHNTIPMLRKIVPEIRAQKMLAKDGVLVASHLARTLHGTHAETEKILQPLGLRTAYDGLCLQF